MNNPDEIDIDIDDENDENDADIEEGTIIHLQVVLKFDHLYVYKHIQAIFLCFSR